MKTKVCPRCKLEKTIDVFPVSNGRITYCNDCKKAYDREYWERNKSLNQAKKRETQSAIRKRNRLYIITLLQKSKCSDCKNTDWRVLEFDHKNTFIKKFNLADCSYQSIASIQNEIDKCDIVCANCHRIRTIKQRNYYQ